MSDKLTHPVPVPIQLLPGWTAERYFPNSDEAVILHAPGIGAVTVNYNRRNFRLGVGLVRDYGQFKGLGWRARLFRAATAALRECAPTQQAA